MFVNFAKDQSDDYHSKDSLRQKDSVIDVPMASSRCQADFGEAAAAAATGESMM